MSWRVRTPPAQRGGQHKFTAATALRTIAQCEIESDTGEAVPMTIYLGVDSLNANLAAADNLYWTIQWGYGGAIFEDTFLAQAGSFTKVADLVRVSARMASSLVGGTVNAASTITARAMIVPAVLSETRRPSNFATIASVQGNLTPQGNPQLCTLLRIWGYNEDAAATCYIDLYDKAAAVINGDFPVYPVAIVPPKGTFSLEIGTTGIPFFHGGQWAVSSTPNLLTLPVVTFYVTAETLPLVSF